MFKNQLKKIMDNEEEDTEGNNKKKIENLVFFVILMIITIVFINVIWNGNKKEKEENVVNDKKLATNIGKDKLNSTEVEQNEIEKLENKLKNILSKIEGVGEVEVCVNYSESSEVIAMYNENSKINDTEETDTSGGIRKIKSTDIQKDIIYEEENGEKKPITQKVIQPKIEGAIITAKGANNVNVKTNIIQAVEALTGLATHKIQVFEMN